MSSSKLVPVLETSPRSFSKPVKWLSLLNSILAWSLSSSFAFKAPLLSNRLKVIQGDVLKTDLPYFDICVANIPYQISSPLTFKLLFHQPAFRCAIIMFQREFAQLLVAQPGDNLYCWLYVNTQFYARVFHLLKVGKNNFRPPPKVDSLL